MTGSDPALIERIRRGDDAAFRSLFNLYYTRIFAFVQRRLGDAALSEEVTSDVFFEVWRSAEGFPGRLEGLDVAVRDRDLQMPRGRPQPPPTQARGRDPDPGRDPVAGVRRHRRPGRARSPQRTPLDPRPHRGAAGGPGEVAELALFDGHSTDEIAQRLGLSPGTVKSRLSRARRELRRRPPMRGDLR